MTEDKDETVEVGECIHCGEVEGPFEFRQGPRCPECGSVLFSVVEVEQSDPSTIEADLDAEEYLDGDLR